MPWNETDIVAPPRDRVIEVTSGAAWAHEDSYQDADQRYRPDTTWRTWRFQGGVALVIWRDNSTLATKMDAGGAWIETTSGGLFGPFRFWREYENPLAGRNGLLTSTTPPYPIEQKFKGDARLRLYDQIEAEIRKNIAWAEGVIARDVAEGRQPGPGTVRALAAYETKLAKTLAARASAYDPYDLPEDVRGIVK